EATSTGGDEPEHCLRPRIPPLAVARDGKGFLSDLSSSTEVAGEARQLPPRAERLGAQVVRRLVASAERFIEPRATLGQTAAHEPEVAERGSEAEIVVLGGLACRRERGPKVLVVGGQLVEPALLVGTHQLALGPFGEGEVPGAMAGTELLRFPRLCQS